MSIGGLSFHEKNAAPWAGHKPTTSVTLGSAHRPTNLRYGENLAGLYWNAIEFLELCYCLFWFWLVGLSPSDMSWRPLLVGRHICYNVMTLQLGNCPFLAVWLRPTTRQLPTTNNTQTKHMQLVGSSSGAANFLFDCLIWEKLMVPRLA